MVMFETVEIHFEGESLPVLTRWRINWEKGGKFGDELMARPRSEAGLGQRFHWNLPLMALCFGLLRLETTRGGETVLLRGGPGSAAGVLAECCTHRGAAERLRPVLVHPHVDGAADPQSRLNRWFKVLHASANPSKQVIFAGPQPPGQVIVWLDGQRVESDDFPLLETKLEWMTEERDWLGSVVGRPNRAAVA